MAILVSLKTIAPVAFAALIGLVVHMWHKQRRTIGYITCFCVFYVYVLFVGEYTIFPLRLFDPEFTDFMKQHGDWTSGLNLIPFRNLSLEYLTSVQGLGNVILTIPFGFGLPFLRNTSLKSVSVAGLIFTGSIELAQLLCNAIYGYPHRIVDVNDILFNLVGTVVGFGVFLMLSRLYRRAVHEDSVDGPWEHFHGVLVGYGSRSATQDLETTGITTRTLR